MSDLEDIDAVAGDVGAWLSSWLGDRRGVRARDVAAAGAPPCDVRDRSHPGWVSDWDHPTTAPSRHPTG